MCLISIIIVNWNGINLISECLDSVLKQDFKDFEVILVDNGSTDGSSDFVEKKYPSVRLLKLHENRGFTGGNLAGMELARGSFIALLNNDTRVEKGWLGSLYRGITLDSNIGICASKIIIEGTDLVDSVGDIFTTAFTGTKLGHLRRSHEFSTPMFVHGGCAAAVLYRKAMLDQIGFLDDDFYFNHEDTDLNLRAWFSGWKCFFQPDAVVYHKVSASIGELSAKAVYYFSRNNEYVWLKNVPFVLMIRFFPHRILYEIFSFAYYGIRSRRLWPFINGKLDALRMMPTMLAKRREIKKTFRSPNGKIARELKPLHAYLRQRLSDK